LPVQELKAAAHPSRRFAFVISACALSMPAGRNGLGGYNNTNSCHHPALE